ncbi:MAG: site-specific integrase, partial [candidate division WOR-3 bacterium]
RRVRKQFPDRADAEAFLNKLRHEKHLARLGVMPEKRAGAIITLSELFARYLEWAKTAHSKSYLRSEVFYAAFFLEALGDLPLSQPRTERVLETLQCLALSHSPSTVNRYYAFIRSVFNRAVEWGILEASPLKGIRPLREPAGRIRYLSPDEAQALLNACRNNLWLFAFVAIALYTGMRIGEIRALRWEDVDLERGIIRVRESKTGSARLIPLHDDLRKLLIQLPRGDDNMALRMRYPEKAFRKACHEAGIRDFRFHDLRHTYASWKVMDGVDLRTLAELLGSGPHREGSGQGELWSVKKERKTANPRRRVSLTR